jgi:hypothetical protein
MSHVETELRGSGNLTIALKRRYIHDTGARMRGITPRDDALRVGSNGLKRIEQDGKPPWSIRNLRGPNVYRGDD